MQSESYARLNIYDIFADILPGAVFVAGLAFPFIRNEPDLNIVEGIGFLVLAFTFGLWTQSLGSRFGDGDKPFNEYMENLVECERSYDSENQNDTNISFGGDKTKITKIDLEFLHYCRDTYEIEDDFDDWGHLFKLLMSQLEGSAWSRTVRIQTLHLATRGLYVSFFLLTIYYTILLTANFAPVSSFIRSFSPGFLLLSGYTINVWDSILIIAFNLALFKEFRRRSKHFEHDVVMYIVSELTLIRI